jgi:hypothetical protein
MRLLSQADKEIVRLCLVAVLEGPWIEDWEFHTRLGIDRRDLWRILSEGPHLDDSGHDSIDCLAINNCLNEVCYGIPISEEEWRLWFQVSRETIQATYGEWARLKGFSHTGLR